MIKKRNKIVVIGANNDNFTGKLCRYLNAKALSRSTGFDVGDPKRVEEFFKKNKVDNLVFAAATYPEPANIGEIQHWSQIKELYLTRILGITIVLNYAQKYNVKKIIILAGSDLSIDPTFGHFTIVNNAIMGSVKFATLHTKLKVYYLDLKVVRDSPVGKRYLLDIKPSIKKIAENTSITIREVYLEIKNIINDKYQKGDRIIMGSYGQENLAP